MKLKHALVCFVFAVVPIVSNASVEENNLFNKIALCESGNTAHAKNPKSTASGRFQFIETTWKYYGIKLWGDEWIKRNVFDYNDNTDLAYFVFDKYGVKDWYASKWCWSVNDS